MKVKKLYTAIVVAILLISPLVTLCNFLPTVNAGLVEKIVNGSFEECYAFLNWTGTGEIVTWCPHTGHFSLYLDLDEWMQSDNLGNVPVENITSFGFYYVFCDTLKFTIIFSDGSNVTGTVSYAEDWAYVNLMSYLVSGKEVSYIRFDEISGGGYIDDVSLIADGVEKVPNGSFDDIYISGWLGYAIPSNVYKHSGSYSIVLPYYEHLIQYIEDAPPIKMVYSFGFYYYAEDSYYCGGVIFTIFFSDGSNVSDSYSPWRSGWSYVDLTDYLPYDKPNVKISAIQLEANPNRHGAFYIDDVSLMVYGSIYELENTISFSFLVAKPQDFTFTAYLYIDNLDLPLDTEMRIILIHEYEGDECGSATLNVYLYANSTGFYIHAVGGTIGSPEEPMGSGYAPISLKQWYFLCYYHFYFNETETEAWAFYLNDTEVFSGAATSPWDYHYDYIALGAWGIIDANYTLYYDNIDWAEWYEDFEGEFPGDWDVCGDLGLSTSHYVSPIHSLQVPLPGGMPLSVSVTPETVTINRNTTQTFEATASGGSPPYNYKWYVNGTIQGETSSTFNFRTENLGVYEIWCNVTDCDGSEAKSNVAICNVESISLEVTVSPLMVSINLGEYKNVTASVVGGTPPLQYRWYRNGTLIGTNASRLEINATAWGVGVWRLHCNVTDSLNVENKSNTIYVYISAGVLTVTISPSGTINSYKGLKTVFSASVSGGIPPYRYEWYVNNQLKSTNSTYTLIHQDQAMYNVILKVYDSGVNSQWSNTATVVAVYPTVSISPKLKSIQVGQSVVLTCIATPGMGSYIFTWMKDDNVIYQSAPTTNNINRYTYTPSYSEPTGEHYFWVTVTFNTTYIEPFSADSEDVATIYVFGKVKRLPSIVDTLTTPDATLPIGHLAQKTAFSAYGYYWQFYFDGYLKTIYGNKYLHGYIRYKYSMDTQLWVEPPGSPFSHAKVLDDIAFYAPSLVPSIYHGWGGGVPFTLYFDNATGTLYLVYSTGTSTGLRRLRIVEATFNETAIDWDWGTPDTIATFNNPRLPVCPTLTLASNGNPFVAFLVSYGNAYPPAYTRMLAYYNGEDWHVYPPDVTLINVGPMRLVNVGTKIYITTITSPMAVAIFDTTTETITESWEADFQDIIPDDPNIWNFASYIDSVTLSVRVRVDGFVYDFDTETWLHVDIYNGTCWFNDIAKNDPLHREDWHFIPEKLGEYTTCLVRLDDYLPTDRNLRNCRVRFWFTNNNPGRTLTCTIDQVSLVLKNSFGYVIETVPVVDYSESLHDVGRTWQTLKIDGYTAEETGWVKVGSSPYLNRENDGSYITTTTPWAVDAAYTFEDLPFPNGTVHGAYLYIRSQLETATDNAVDVYIYDGSSWRYAETWYSYSRNWYANVTNILNTFEKVNNAKLKFVHRSSSRNFTIDYAELIVDYDYVDFPDNWVTSGDPPYLNTAGAGNVSVTQSPVSLHLWDEGKDIYMPVPNMISFFNFTNTYTSIQHSVNMTSPIYIGYYQARDVVFQDSPNGYLSAFLLAETGQTLVQGEKSFTDISYRHDYGLNWDEGGWWNYTLYYMNLTADIKNVFDAKTVGVRIGTSTLFRFWNDTLDDFQEWWVTQTDGLYSGTRLASSLTLDGTPLCFHYYNNSMYVTRYNGYGWKILKFLEENSTILRMNYGEDRCFSYVIQTSSYDVKFFMPFVRVTVKAQTVDGTPLEGVGLLMNGELIYTPYNNSYDVIGPYSITLYPEHVYFKKDSVTYAFLYYIVEASPQQQYNTAHFTINVNGDITITIVYGVAAPSRPPEITPTPPEEITYCLPLIFYILMFMIFVFGLYLYSQRETWKISIPLILIVLWLILFEPKTPIDQMPIAFLRQFIVPPWHIYMAIILTIIACAALLSKERK